MRPARQRRRAATFAVIVLVATAGILQIACISAGKETPPPPKQQGTPPGIYTVTVTASSGSLQRTANVTLTVR
jgi:hypothetical protein